MAYSSLEDVWGHKPHTKRSKRSKKKLEMAGSPEPLLPTPDLADPICDLYDTKYRKQRRSNRKTYDPWDSSASIHHPFSVISDASNTLEDDADPIENEIEMFDPKPPDQEAKPEVFRKNDKPPPRRSHENHDVFLYVFSGVILLFVLEQFIQVGLHIGVRQLDMDFE